MFENNNDYKINLNKLSTYILLYSICMAGAGVLAIVTSYRSILFQLLIEISLLTIGMILASTLFILFTEFTDSDTNNVKGKLFYLPLILISCMSLLRLNKK
ncbi:MAG: hypothetical protein ACRC5M_05645 [Anaeroplasmataceae bacterium]